MKNKMGKKKEVKTEVKSYYKVDKNKTTIDIVLSLITIDSRK